MASMPPINDRVNVAAVRSQLPVILPQWATANRERQGALTESRTTISGDTFYREWLCGAGQGCRGRILERLYIDHCLPLTVELFRQLAFFILSCKPISYAVFCLKKKKTSRANPANDRPCFPAQFSGCGCAD